jgi:pyruvate/2-oxoglutarate/acetoin dehydrogenase E1 component/TPP-dependent pyruvate/acetoin dehydrogenase alpha subunit
MTDQLTSGIDRTVLASSEEQRYRDQVLHDYWICCLSREVSILGRKEVLGGKAKFGILGDGKEVPQVAMARAFQKGDWRSGYYRDQTFMFALGLATVDEFFAQIYADTENDPWSGGRQMNSHFATPLFDEQGEWLDHANLYNISSDVSCTGGQMARAAGLALASKKYRELPQLDKDARFSKNGDEICFTTIGDASTSEGVFWETVNAAGVMQIPMLIAVWDDGYGISVPTQVQTTKGSISQVLEGFKSNEKGEGIDIHVAKCWDYKGLCELFQSAADKIRQTHTPALIHVEDCTQQLGHSTSGSHERYKSPERLQWEKDNDCIVIMADWIVKNHIASAKDLEAIQEKARTHVREAKDKAWKAYSDPIQLELKRLNDIFTALLNDLPTSEPLTRLHNQLKELYRPCLSDLYRIARRLHFSVGSHSLPAVEALRQLLDEAKLSAIEKYHTHLHSSGKYAALNVPLIPPTYSEQSEFKNGYEVLNIFFEKALGKFPHTFAFGEDVGKIGGVNQSFMGMQDKYGVERVFDTGIREWTIVGQAIGMAMRGLRPIAEIQYLDYLIYGLEPLTDDLATLRYRSNNMQRSPAIIRTRGHRLEGIWHSGSPIGMILHSLRGIYVLVPRNFVQAAGFYNTMLHSDDPALIIECLNGYRLKERLPDNIGEYTVPLGMPEILQEGTDLTLVTYGSCVRIAQEAVSMLWDAGISVELIDVQTLLPFDLEHRIVASLKKTNRILFLDEDVPGGTTAYMMQEVLEKQGGYYYLDSPPVTLTAKPHRPPYGSDGDYFSKPNAEDVYEAVFNLVTERA